MSIPLVEKAEKDDINTSIIAIKRQIERINMLLGLSNSEEIDTSEFVKKSDIVDVVEAGNMNPVTSNAVVPVDEVAVDNMHSVTSNAVATCFNFQSGVFNIGSMSAGSYSDLQVAFDTPFKDTGYSVCLNWVSPSNGERAFYTVDVKTVNGFRIYVKAIEAISVLQIEWQAFYIPH